MNQPNQQQMGGINCMEFINKLPFFTRALYFSIAALWLLDLVSGIPKSLLGANVENTYENMEYWTVITANLFVERFSLMIIIVFNFSTFLSKLQEKVSTPILILKFIANGVLVQILTIALQYFLFYPSNEYTVFGIQGLWFNMIVKYCFYNSKNPIKFCCFNWKVSKKIYPFVLFVVISLLMFHIYLSMIVGIALAFVQIFLQKYVSFISKNPCYSKLGALLNFNQIGCWVNYDQYRQQESYSDISMYSGLEDLQQSGLREQQSLDKSPSEDPFANKKGVRLDDY